MQPSIWDNLSNAFIKFSKKIVDSEDSEDSEDSSTEALEDINFNLRAQAVLREVVAFCYQHQQYGRGVDNKVPQLYATQSEPLDYTKLYVNQFVPNKLTF